MFLPPFLDYRSYKVDKGFPPSSVSKESACNAGDLGSIPRSGRSPGGGNGNPLQYPCLENPIDRGAWQATVHGVTRVRYNLATKPPPRLIKCFIRVGVSIETCILSHVKQHQSRFDAGDRVLRAGALGWPWGMGWGGRWGRGFRMGSTGTPMADSCEYIAKTTTIL